MIKFFKDLETELKIRGFSNQTIKSYIYHNQKFLDFANSSKTKTEFQQSLGSTGSKRVPENITSKDLKAYLAYLLSDKGLSPASANLSLSAIRFFYREVLEKNIFEGIKKRPKLEKKLPVVLTKDEIRCMLEVTKKKKHKLIIELLYSTGMRVSEAVNIRKKDINLNEKLIFVKYGKGKKERFVQLSNKFTIHLQSYLKRHKGTYLFSYRGKPISTRQAQRIVKKAGLNANVQKKVFCHALRSSYATHLLDSGVDIRVIQEFLGHENLSTTQRYTKVSKELLRSVKNPLDSL